MDFKRLFHVLVIGGSVIGCEKTRTDSLPARDKDDASLTDAEIGSDAAFEADAHDDRSSTTVSADVGTEVHPVDGSKGDLAGADARSDAVAKGSPCICSPTKCCVQHEGGTATVSPGMECCWGTSC